MFAVWNSVPSTPSLFRQPWPLGVEFAPGGGGAAAGGGSGGSSDSAVASEGRGPAGLD